MSVLDDTFWSSCSSYNLGAIPLEVVVGQADSYREEDDIVRFEDV